MVTTTTAGTVDTNNKLDAQGMGTGVPWGNGLLSWDTPTAEALGLLVNGKIDMDTYQAWDQAIKAAVAAEITKRERAAAEKVKGPGQPKKRVTIGESGKFSATGLTQKGEGFPPTFYPQDVPVMMAMLPAMLQGVIDNADKVTPKDAKRKEQRAGWTKDAGGTRFVERAHKRAGKSVLAWEGIVKDGKTSRQDTPEGRAAVVAECKAILEKLQAAGLVNGAKVESDEENQDGK